MPKVQAHARTRDGHTFQGSVSDLASEEVAALMEHLDENWGDTAMFRISTEEGFTCIPMDNLSSLSFSVVDEG